MKNKVHYGNRESGISDGWLLTVAGSHLRLVFSTYKNTPADTKLQELFLMRFFMEPMTICLLFAG